LSPGTVGRVLRGSGRLCLVSGLVAMVVVLASGCGATGSTTTVVAKAGQTTTAAGSFRMTQQSSVFDTANPSHVDSVENEQAVIDLAHNRGEWNAVTNPAQPDSSAQPPEHITIGADEWVMEPSGGGKTWTHSSAPKGTPSFLATLQPAGMLDRLKAEEGQYQLVGHDTVRGVPTDHYSLAATTLGPSAPGERLDVWVSADHLVRRLRSTGLRPAESDSTITTPAQTWMLTLEFFDFGIRTDIQAPPASQVDG
jgi:hypothetical protein